jgi:hypothetical protein
MLLESSGFPPVARVIGDLPLPGSASEHAQIQKPLTRPESDVCSDNNGMIDRFAAWMCEVLLRLCEVDIEANEHSTVLDHSTSDDCGSVPRGSQSGQRAA